MSSTTTRRCLCSLCNEPGHNVRSCQDPRIAATWNLLLQNTILQKIIHFTGFASHNFIEELQWIRKYIIQNISLDILNVIGARYAKVRYGSSMEEHISGIAHSVISELLKVVELDEESRKIWVDDFPMVEDTSKFETFHPVIVPVISAEPIQPGARSECSICLEDKDAVDILKTNCGHSFCKICICTHIDSKITASACPMCRTEISTLEVKDEATQLEIKDKYCELAAILRDSYFMAYRSTEFAWGPLERQIEIIIGEYTNDASFMRDIGAARTNLAKAKIIWHWTHWLMTVDDDSDYESDSDHDM